MSTQQRVGDFFRLRIHLIQRNVVGQSREGPKSPAALKQSNIGVAVASNWFIGGSPRISSIVRRRLVVLYCVLTTAPRLVYGLTH